MGISELEFQILRQNQALANGKPLRRRRMKTPLERELRKQSALVLLHDGWREFAMETIADRSRGRGFGEKGMPDSLFIRYGTPPRAELLWVEWKSGAGEVKAHQAAWHAMERDRGAMVVAATIDFEPSVDGFCAWYEASGLRRAR